MKRRNVIWKVLKRTGSLRLLYGFIIVFIIISITIMIVEPNINTIGDGIWYCFNVMTTIGIGDITAETVIGRVLSIVLSIYSILIIAVIPGVLTSYYIESVKIKSNESAEKFMYDLERLTELSYDELAELSEKAKNFHKNKNK